MLLGGRIHERTEDPPEDGRVVRGSLVGIGSGWASPLLPLSPPLPHSSRPSGILLHSYQSEWEALQPGIRRARRIANGTHREKAPESVSAWHEGVQHGHGRLQHGLFLLSELGYLEIPVRPGPFAACSPGRCAASGSEIRLRLDRLHV